MRYKVKLKHGDIVVTRDGRVFSFIEGRGELISNIPGTDKLAIVSLKRFNFDLIHDDYHKWDIMKIYRRQLFEECLDCVYYINIFDRDINRGDK